MILYAILQYENLHELTLTKLHISLFLLSFIMAAKWAVLVDKIYALVHTMIVARPHIVGINALSWELLLLFIWRLLGFYNDAIHFLLFAG